MSRLYRAFLRRLSARGKTDQLLLRALSDRKLDLRRLVIRRNHQTPRIRSLAARLKVKECPYF